MAIRGQIGTKITINPIYMTNRRCPGSFGKIEDLVANPGDLTNFAPNRMCMVTHPPRSLLMCSLTSVICRELVFTTHHPHSPIKNNRISKYLPYLTSKIIH